MKMKLGMLVGGLLLLAGCGLWTVGPDYVEPTLESVVAPTPDAGAPTTNLTVTGEFKSAESNADTRVTITSQTLCSWWNQFNDSVLSNLVESAVSNNLSFLMVQQRLMQARWQLVSSASVFLPKVDLDGAYTRSWARKNTSSQVASGRNYSGNKWSSGFDASWEIDVFGGNRRAFEAAHAELEKAECTLENAWVTLTSEIGREYITLRTTQERLRVARANLKLQSETYDILNSRLTSGIGDELAVNQAKYNVEQTRATIPSLLTAEENCMNALAILVGTMPGALHEMLVALPARDWLIPPQRLAGIELNMMRDRPDVCAAERALAAQVAAVGVAKSQFFPKLYINGSLGLDSVKASKFFSRDAFLSSIGPSFSWPIFQGGNLLANLRMEETKMNEAALNYELTVQKAYQETRNAYSAYTQEYHRYQSLQGAVRAATDAVTISQDLYKNGLADFNNVLDAQRSRLALEESLTLSRGDITLNLIALYKALGGGLEP